MAWSNAHLHGAFHHHLAHIALGGVVAKEPGQGAVALAHGETEVTVTHGRVHLAELLLLLGEDLGDLLEHLGNVVDRELVHVLEASCC